MILTLYGIMTFTFYLLQFFFAYLNNLREKSDDEQAVRLNYINNIPLINTYGTINSDSNSSIEINFDEDTVEVCAVGYQEEPELFRKCLQSIKDADYPGLRTTIVIDGNDHERDFAMLNVAKEVFSDRIKYYNLDHVPDELPTTIDDKFNGMINFNNEILNTNTVLCITQPHRGKRNAMYTAFCIAKARKSAYVLNTDSDTVLDTSCLQNMMRTMKKNPKNGAVAGVLKLYGPFNWLVKMTAARYRIAFEVERSAQGYWGSVLCVSGPLGLYKLSAVNKVRDTWVNQHFLGHRCTFGDDRAMSNYLLKERYEIAMCTTGIAHTEAPDDFSRFVSQQTRWCRSFWRELFLNLNHVPNKWTWAELCYYGLFPVVLLSTVLADDLYRTPTSALILMITCTIVPLIRITIVGMMFGYQQYDEWYTFYSFMFILVLLPIKLFALVSMNSGGWETSRFAALTNRPVFVVYGWWIFLILGTLHRYYHGSMVPEVGIGKYI